MRWKRSFPTQQKFLQKIWVAYLRNAEGGGLFYQFDRWLEKEFRNYKQFGKRDRAWYSDELYAALRFARLALFLWQEKNNSAPLPTKPLATELLEIEESFFWQVVDQRSYPEDSVADENIRSALARVRDDARLASQSLWNGIAPEWEGELLVRAKASAWEQTRLAKFIADQSARSPLWLRVKSDDVLPGVLDEMKLNGIEVVACDALALCISGQKKVTQFESYRSGAFEIQDWASQQIGNSLRFSPDARVWDACAGSGGKSAQIAARLDERGFLAASDTRDFVLPETAARIERAGSRNFKTFRWSGENPLETENFDAVLVDAPCSSSGVMRRNPELRLKIVLPALDELCDLQLRLLSAAATAVRPGGCLVYATCSFFVCENEGIVEKFLSNSSQFELVRATLHGAPDKNSDTTFSATFNRKI